MVSVEVRPYQFGWFLVVKLVWSLSHTYYYQISRRQTTSCADANCNSFCRTSLGWRVGLDAFRWVVKCEWMSIIGWWQENCCWGDQCLHKQIHIGILFWITHPLNVIQKRMTYSMWKKWLLKKNTLLTYLEYIMTKISYCL